MRIIRASVIFVAFVAALLLTGCGETYRPVVIPLPTPGGDPQAQGAVVVGNQGVHVNHSSIPDGTPCDETNSSGPDTVCPGSTTDIDIAGDVNSGNHVVGENPWTAILSSAGVVYTANRGSNTLSNYSAASSGSTTLTVSMPSTVSAKVDTTTSNTIDVAPVNSIASIVQTLVFATMPACGTLSGTVCTSVDRNRPGVMAFVTNNTFIQAYQVDKNPVMAVALPDSSKVYVVNEGSGTVTGFAQLDRTRIANIAGFASPVYAIATPDSSLLFVLNRANNTVGVVKTSTDSLILSASFGATPSPASDLPPSHPMFYDARRQRLWVTSSAAGTVTVFDTSQLASNSTMPVLATVHVPGAPLAVTVLSDGSRGYVLSGGSSASVSSIDANNFGISTFADYKGAGPRDIVSSPDGTKVYVVNHDPSVIPSPDPSAPAGSTVIIQQPGTNIITTSTNSFLKDNNGAPFTIVAPFQDIMNCTIDTPQPWLPDFNYLVNAPMVPRSSNGHAYRATVAGKSGASDPAFCTTAGCTFTDGGVTWMEIGAPRSCPRQRPSFATVPQ